MNDLDVLEITEDDILYRYLSPDEIEPDGNTVKLEAYYDTDHNGPDGEISVSLNRLVSAERMLGKLSKKKWAGTRIGALPAHIPMRLGLTVIHTPETSNPAHASIKGVHSDRQCRMLARDTVILPGER